VSPRATVIALAAVLMMAAAVVPPRLPGTASRAVVPADPALQRVREMYFAAVQHSDRLAAAEAEVDRQLDAARPGSPREAVLTAYRGALMTLRAKHGRWPPARLRDLQQGLDVLDAVVEAHPSLTEPRYLRLMSCYYLPAILGRGGSVRDDFAALARLLPAARPDLPPDLYEAVAIFVLDKGDIPAEPRARLEHTLDR
jgi:hypothetical protein